MTSQVPLSVAGVGFSVTACGINKPNRDDLCLIEITEGTSVAAVFTQNAFCAAPVLLSRQHLEQAQPRYLLINSGNANAGTGDQGDRDAKQCCSWLAEQKHVNENQVLVFSTGVIGQPLPMPQLHLGISQLPLPDELSWQAAAEAIMTTDTRAKTASREMMFGKRCVRITGMAKGSGMICPNMATMLAFIATDVQIQTEDLQTCLQAANELSFNCISVDGDTSTNDAAVLMATGASQVSIKSDSPEWLQFQTLVTELCQDLAQQIVRDGEGATKFIHIVVSGGEDIAACRKVATVVANSPLVKTAFFASDANWGRILAAVGRSGLVGLDITKVSLFLDDLCIIEHGLPAPGYTDSAGQKIMAKTDIRIGIDLGRGATCLDFWSCDFSTEYVNINASYRS